MKTIYNQLDVGRRARWLHPLILTVIIVFSMLAFNAQAANNLTWGANGPEFCWDGTKTTTIGLDVTQGNKWHILFQFEKDGDIVIREQAYFTTGAAGSTVTFGLYGASAGDQGLWVCYVGNEDWRNTVVGTPTIANILGSGSNTGERQNGEVWIYDPTLLVFNLTPYGSSYTGSGPYVYCDGAAGVTLDDSELSKYTALVTNGIIATDKWVVNYELFKDGIATGDVEPGTGTFLHWTGLDAAPNSYTVKASRVGGCPTASMNNTVTLNDQSTVKNDDTGLCYLTITAAIAGAVDGQTLLCLKDDADHIYNENLIINKDITLKPVDNVIYVKIAGSIDIASNGVTIQDIWTIDSPSTYAITIIAPSSGYLLENNGIGALFSNPLNGIIIENGAGGGLIQNNFIGPNFTGINIEGSIIGTLSIIDNEIYGELNPTTELGIINNASGVIIDGNYLHHLDLCILNNGDDTQIFGNNFFNILTPGGVGVQNTATGVDVYDNDFGNVQTTAINSTQPLNAVSNWYGDRTGPTIASNPCGTGSAIVETNAGDVDYSPWWYQAAMTSKNGLPEVTLTDIPNISTITNTPVVYNVTDAIPLEVADYDNNVKVNVRISADPAFPAGAKIISLKLEGTEVMLNPLGFDLSGKTMFYLSQVMGGLGPLNIAAGMEHDWEMVVSGMGVEDDYDIDWEVISYFSLSDACKNVLSAKSFTVTYADATVAVANSPVNTVCTGNPLQFTVDVTYPAIVNLDTRVLADARINLGSGELLPQNTVIKWGYNVAPTNNYTVTTPGGINTILLSQITGMTAPLQGHTGTDHWNFEIVHQTVTGAPAVYNLTINGIAAIEPVTLPARTEFVYASAPLVLTVNPLPTAVVSVDGNNTHICSGFTPTMRVTLTGQQPFDFVIHWTTATGSGTIPVTGHASSTYTFNPSVTVNTNFQVKSLTDANTCQGANSNTLRMYVGTVTTAGEIDYACEGEEILVPVYVENFEDVGAVSLTLNYSTSVLSYISYVNPWELIPPYINVVANGSSVPGKVTISVLNYNPLAPGYILPDDEVLVYLKFRFKGGTTPLTWDVVNPAACEYFSHETQLPFCDTPPENYYIDGSVTGDYRLKATLSEDTELCNDGSTADLTVTLTYGYVPGETWYYTINNGPEQSVTGTDVATYTVSPSVVGPHTYAITTLGHSGVSPNPRCASIPSDFPGTVEVLVTPLPDAPATTPMVEVYTKTAHTNEATVSQPGVHIVYYTTETGMITTTAPTGTNVGTYTAWAEAVFTATTCKSATRTLVTLEITPRPITVTANASQTKVYGEFDPLPFTYTSVPALYSGDLFTGVLSRDAGENVGLYPILKNDLSAGPNYTITYVGDNFSITRKPITVTADASQTKVYGNYDPAFTYTASPLIGTPLPNPAIGSVALGGVLARDPGENVVGSPYAITEGTVTNVTNPNYDITFYSAGFNITPLPIDLIVTAGQSKVYGSPDPIFLYTTVPAEGTELDNGELVGLTGLLTREPGETVIDSPYDIYQGGITDAPGVNSNYTITYYGNTFAITPKLLTPAITAADKCFDGLTNALPLTSQTLSVVEGSDDVSLVVANAEFEDAAAGSGKLVTASGLSLDGADASNYYLSPLATATTTATIWALPTGTIAASAPITCNGGTGTVTITYTGGYTAETYTFNGVDQTTGVFTNIPYGTYLWDIEDNHGCLMSEHPSFTMNQPAPKTVSGIVSLYKPLAPLPMQGVSVKLVNQVSPFNETTPVTTNASGEYTIPNVCTGTYNIICSLANAPANNPVNTTDAALVNAWGALAFPPSIEKVKFYAGDVVLTNQLDATDAGRIQSYFLTSGIPGWANRDIYTFWLAGDMISANEPFSTVIKVPSVSVVVEVIPPVTPVTNLNLYALFTGDFDASGLKPSGAKAASSSLQLNYTETIRVDANSEFELPVYAGSAMEVGAISLIMNFPQDKLEIIDMKMAGNTSSQLLYNVMGDELRISWTSTTPLSLNAGEKILVMNLRLKGSLGQDEVIRFNLVDNPLNELADGNSSVLGNAVLFMNTLAAAPTGIVENNASEKLTLFNYPNPFTETTTFVYSLPFAGETTLEVFNILGSKVAVFVNDAQAAGDYRQTVSTSSLKPGVYTATLKLKAEGQTLNRTIKIVRNQ